MKYKQLILTQKKTKTISKVFGGVLIILGVFLFLTGLLALLTIIGIFYTLGAGMMAFGLGYLGLSLIVGKVKTKCPYCKGKLTILLIPKHSIRCVHCWNLILLKLKDIQKPKKQRNWLEIIWLVPSWIVSIIFLLGGLTELKNNYVLGGILIILGALLILPPLKELIQKNVNLPSWVFWILFVILVMVGFNLVG